MFLRLLIIIVSIFLLNSCQVSQNTGVNIADSKISKVAKGVSTKEDVIKIMGSPSIVPLDSNNEWYYVSREISKRAFFEPKVTNQRIVKLLFKNNILENIELYDNNFNDSINPIEDRSETPGVQQNIIKQYINNLGRFNKKDKKNNKKR